MARVYKPKNSIKWCCSIEVGTCGKRQRVVRGGFKTKKEAQQALADLQMKDYNGTLNLLHKIILIIYNKSCCVFC